MTVKPEKVDLTMDARGMLCPMPVVKATKSIAGLAEGQVMELLATDRGACADIPAWCRARRHELLHQDEVDGVYRFYVQKGR
jgi:tRNA 2-thiouridine synthesizing protein A